MVCLQAATELELRVPTTNNNVHRFVAGHQSRAEDVAGQLVAYFGHANAVAAHAEGIGRVDSIGQVQLEARSATVVRDGRGHLKVLALCQIS